MSSPHEPITSAQNPRVQRLRQLVRTPAAYRQQGLIWIEGEHLLTAALEAGLPLDTLVATPGLVQDGRCAGLLPQWQAASHQTLWLEDRLFAAVSDLVTPVPVAALVQSSRLIQPALLPDAPTLVLDRLQDTGNVGSLMRTARAMGYRQVLALAGTAALASPKVMRAAQGAHFGLHLVEGLAPDALADLRVPLLATALDAPHELHRTRLPWPCAWVLGHEGQGVAATVQARCAQTLRIAMPGGFESLNVAAAGAICLYAALPWDAAVPS
ncbi:TrmH family RNA methyltransferase [Amphibiibacter pelophylacis]|uniref:RNA methyltransferase n=1 Tax=Amphibiibacter pelophylacis TaxID=1799477 RepID=A0ACC6P127_9BURK